MLEAPPAESTEDPVQEGPSASWAKLAVVVPLLLLIFAICEHDTIYANGTIAEIAESDIRDKYVDQIETGNRLRQVALLGYGLMGVAGLAWFRDRPLNIRWGAAAPLLLLLAWTVLSTAWSDQPFVTAKRQVILACLIVGSAGLARALGPRDLLLCTILSLGAFIAGALVIDIALGGRPWAGGDYRFGGTLHPNCQAVYCGVLCLALVTQPVGFGRRWMPRLAILFLLGLIVLTGSRTGLLSLAVSMMMVWMIRLHALFRWAGMALALAGVAACFVAWNSVGDGVRAQTVNTVLLGRTEQAKSFSGRVPLWEELANYSRRKPVTGYGYEGFWTQDRIAAIMKSQNWTMQNAHNSYFEIVLQLGLVGLAFALWFLFSGTGSVIAAYERTQEPAYAFLFGLLIFGMTNSLLESLFVKLRYPTVLTLVGLLLAILFFPPAPADPARPTKDPAAS